MHVLVADNQLKLSQNPFQNVEYVWKVRLLCMFAEQKQEKWQTTLM